MGLADRDYIKQRSGGPGTPLGGFSGGGGSPRGWSVNAWLIAANLAVFVLQFVLAGQAMPVWIEDQMLVRDVPPAEIGVVEGADERIGALISKPLVDTRETPPTLIGRRNFLLMDPATALGHFSTAKAFLWFPDSGVTVLGLQVWRLVTFQFLHHDLMHLVFNMIGLFFFGRAVEDHLGSKRYAAFYLMCGICGGLTYLILNFIGLLGLNLPGALQVAPTTRLVGASAGVFGVIVANAFIHPHARVQFFFLPIPIKMTWFAYGYVAFAAFNLFIAKGQNQGGDAAHLGGAIAGYFFIRRPHLLREFFDVFSRSSDSPKPRKRAGRRGPSGSEADKEVDRVLEKIHREGLASLTEKEKRLLQGASRDRPNP